MCENQKSLAGGNLPGGEQCEKNAAIVSSHDYPTTNEVGTQVQMHLEMVAHHLNLAQIWLEAVLEDGAS